MTFDPVQTQTQITQSMGAMLLLHSSTQALMQVSITRSASPWYFVLDQELGAAENLVVGWRQNGFLYFQQDVLQEIVACGQAFLGAQATIDDLFKQLEADFDQALLSRIAQQLNALATPIAVMSDQIDVYLVKLQAFQQALEVPYNNMNQSVAQIQAQEAQIQAQISAINAQIYDLQQQVIADRQAIAQAEATRNRGIVETIFGILLAPVTGGASLILAGIGVGTIAEAQAKVSQLESTIAGYQSTIVSDQQTLSTDQQQIATLQGLTMSVSIALSDMTSITTALGALRTTWSVLQGMLAEAVSDVNRAQSAKDSLVAQVWFDSACNTWTEVVAFTQSYEKINPPVPTVKMVG